ncbi:MBL fold metallo-hydrolase [Pseudolysinimonas sp.]|uniref:MBL fold metallo-hydrolase n=1 Tax=Pseudolysinimonas sp. TaxID=2680009 RepID=UPI00286A3A90|nr:MBL fold metallo-hydrolase [Pseudolysinimonas sp.]
MASKKTSSDKKPGLGMRVTRIGGPTALVEFDGWRILTDPTFDPPGRRYGFGPGASSVKTTGPAIARDNLGRIDAVLLSHDQHGDNLDDAGREFLADVPVVVTTRSARKRLGGDNIVGLDTWQTTTIERAGGARLVVTATPGRHGPPLSRPIVGPVVGFAVALPGESTTALWMSGDTVDFSGLHDVARRLDIDVALIHIGAVRFPITGPLRYTLDGRHAARVLDRLAPRVAIPVHYEGWSHFSEPEPQTRAALERSRLSDRVRWLPLGVAVDIPARAD